MSRMSELNVLNRDMDMPIVKDGYYLIGYLQEMGYNMSSGERITSLTFQEIKAWSDLTQIELNHNEVLHIKRLSEVFVSAYYQSSAKGAMPFYNKVKPNVGSKLRDALTVLNKK